MKSRFFSLVFAAFAAAQLAAQAELFDRSSRFSMADGLSNPSIWAMAQDADGYLWISTEDGLNRFDGERFERFFSRPGDLDFPTSELTDLLFLAEKNALLVGSNFGISRLDLRTGRFSRIQLPAREGRSSDVFVKKIHRRPDGSLLVAAASAVFELGPDLLEVRRFFWFEKPLAHGTGHFAEGFLELPGGRFAVVSPFEKGLIELDFEQKTTRPCPEAAALAGLELPEGCFLEAKNPAVVWFLRPKKAAANGEKWKLNRLDVQSKKLESWPIAADSKSGFWLPMRVADSLFLIHEREGRPILIDLKRPEKAQPIAGWKSSRSDGRGVASFVDRDGHFWAGPRFEGLHFFPLRPAPVRRLEAVERLAERAGGGDRASFIFGFRGLEKDGKWLFAGPKTGLFRFDPATERAEDLGIEQGVPAGLWQFSRIEKSRSGRVWFFNRDGLFWLDPAAKKAVAAPSSWQKPTLRTELLQPDGERIWINSESHLFLADPATGRRDSFAKAEIGLRRTADFAQFDRAGRAWFSSYRVPFFVFFDPATKSWGRTDTLDLPGIQRGVFEFLRATGDGERIWFFNEKGLFRYEIASKKVDFWDERRGLSHHYVRSICLDATGAVWVGTAHGLNRIDPADGSVRQFFEADGLPSSDVSEISLLDTARNVLAVSGSGGLCILEPSKFFFDQKPPVALVTSLEASGQKIDFSDGKTVALPHSANDLTIRFTGIHFLEGRKNRYRFRLVGADDDWLEGPPTKAAQYLNLAPGSYRFEVLAANASGVWSERPAVLAIVIRPPFWATFWFRAAAFGLFLSLFYWFFKKRVRQIEASEAEKTAIASQISSLEMKALRSQMNPHFVFNALASIQNFVLENRAAEASRYLTKFARLMRLILENSEAPTVALRKEIDLLGHYVELEALRFDGRFRWEIFVEKSLAPESVAVPAMLIQPHVENAIWHGLLHLRGRDGQLFIRFFNENERQLRVEIEDNGVGRAAAKALKNSRDEGRKSRGLANVQARLDLLNAEFGGQIRFETEDLLDEKGAARGTLVRLWAPIGRLEKQT